MDALNAEQILEQLAQSDSERGSAAPAITVLRSVDSTNSEASRQAAVSDSGSIWLAEQQTAGRGRRGRQWVSPEAANIYLSMLWHLPAGLGNPAGLSLAVGVAISDALRAVGFDGAELKWPNDVLVAGRKLGGILLEMHTLSSGQQAMIIGVGLNVMMPAASTDNIEQAWTDLSTELSADDLSRNTLAAHLIAQIRACLREYEQHGFSAFKSRWLALDAFANQQLVLSSGAETTLGQSAGVADDGALLVQTAQGVQSFYGGEISVRLQGETK